MQLIEYLQARSILFAGKAAEVRGAAEHWLGFIPATFPHYTKHSIHHSDTIVKRISQILFDDAGKPSVELSSVEAYLLLVSAYLHDAGMVVSDKEKQELYKLPEWTSWIGSDGAAGKRYRDILEFRTGQYPEDGALRNFLADRQMRFLVAEFYRRRHHLRSGDFARRQHMELGRIGLGSIVAVDTISAICEGHGLNHFDLSDDVRYPERTEVLGETVNVRFLAILLRLGDLLDMNEDRACPLLLHAASPLPPESLPHWSQYSAIKVFSVTPTQIRIRAECSGSDEHRILRDWCQWLVTELDHADVTMRRAARHSQWSPPNAKLGDGESIEIVPGAGAGYVFKDWRIEIDPALVLERLVFDVADSSNGFIRELLQNAIDASRCQIALIYDETLTDTRNAPPELRADLPVVVRHEIRTETNELSGESQEFSWVVVDDSGTGMDEAMVAKYLLQVGRSYYQSTEFRAKYSFQPTSRFGLGFLSCFAVSNRIIVETAHEGSGGAALRMELTGPRNFVAVSAGARKRHGTTVEVRLNGVMEPGTVAELVKGWCKRVEFPVIVEELGQKTVVQAETGLLFEERRIIATDSEKSVSFQIRSYGLQDGELSGEIYLLQIEQAGTSFDVGTAIRSARAVNPYAPIPEPPNTLVCLHGITLDEEDPSRDYGYRVDYRGAKAITTAGRAQLTSASIDDIRERVQRHLAGVITTHIEDERRGRGLDNKYLRALADRFHWLGAYWKERPIVPTRSRATWVSPKDLEASPSLIVVMSEPPGMFRDGSMPEPAFPLGEASLAFGDADIGRWMEGIVAGRVVTEILLVDDGSFALRLETGESDRLATTFHEFQFVDCLPSGVVCMRAPLPGAELFLLNRDHELGRWLRSLAIAVSERRISIDTFETVVDELRVVLAGLRLPAGALPYLSGLKSIEGFPADLECPREVEALFRA